MPIPTKNQCPNPDSDFGHYERLGAIISVGVNEDRILPTCVIQDPIHKRLLMLCTVRKTTITPDNNDGRQVFLFQSPWDNPTEWTRLNAPSNPLICLGNSGDWDEGNIYKTGGCLVGNRLYLAYAGTELSDAAIHPRNLKGLGYCRIGLAFVDLDGVDTNKKATKLTSGTKNNYPQLHLGSIPYQASTPGLHYLNNMFYLWVYTSIDANGTQVVVPRLYTSRTFSAKVGVDGWRCHELMREYGQWDNRYAGGNWHRAVPLDDEGKKWSIMLWEQVGPDGNGTLGATIELQPNKIIYNRTCRLFTQNTTPGQTDSGLFDEPVSLFHLGQWWLFYCGNSTATYVGSKVHCARYVTTGKQQDQTAVSTLYKEYTELC